MKRKLPVSWFYTPSGREHAFVSGRERALCGKKVVIDTDLPIKGVRCQVCELSVARHRRLRAATGGGRC